MAHDHRMNPVGEPHLNAVRRQPQGRSNLRRLTENIASQLHSQMDQSSVFNTGIDPFIETVNARLQNYRLDRNASRADGTPLDMYTEDTAKEVGERFQDRANYSGYDYY
jgi:hypothetical protein